MPLHTNTTIRIEGHRGLAETFASLQIHEHIDDHPRAETQSAVVVGNNDPKDLGRVQVQFRWQQAGRTPWLGTPSPAGGTGKGLYMIPEKGEEVLGAA